MALVNQQGYVAALQSTWISKAMFMSNRRLLPWQ